MGGSKGAPGGVGTGRGVGADPGGVRGSDTSPNLGISLSPAAPSS